MRVWAGVFVFGLAGVAGLAGLAGCAGGALETSGASLNSGASGAGASSDSSSGGAKTAGAKLAGRVYGGQQPIAGAQVYLLAANTGGYGGAGLAASASNASLSLLTSVPGTGPGTTQLDTSGTATNGDYYTTTDANGNWTITGDYTCTAGQQVYLYSLSGDAGGGTNAAAGLMAALGACPAAGNFAATTPYIVINEVSTVAAAYALAGFATDALHVSNSGTALAQTGIANAFGNAANLETLATGVALATTPAGNGTVPQTEINTLANVLAACVNSNGAVTGGMTPTACYTLFTNALAGGTTGTQPADTATAAINIAHNPGTNVANLYALAQGTPPFAPALTAVPNDWTVALTFTGGGMSQSWSVAIDSLGNAWVADGGVNSVTKFNPLGAAISGTNGYAGGGLSHPIWDIAIDNSGNVWVANEGSSISEFNSSGTALSPGAGWTGGGLNYPYKLAIDGLGDVWVANADVNSSSISEFSSSGAPVSGSSGYTANGLLAQFGIAINGSGHVWVSNYAGKSLSEFTSSGTALSGATGGGLNSPCCEVAIDSSGSVWTTNAALPGSLSKFSSSGTAISPATSGYTGGGLDAPEHLAIDGSGNVWVAGGPDNISEFSSSGAAISGSSGYTGRGMISPAGIAVDGSGDVWVGTDDNSITEFIGAGAPVITPICAGLPATPTSDGSSKLGTRP